MKRLLPIFVGGLAWGPLFYVLGTHAGHIEQTSEQPYLKDKCVLVWDATKRDYDYIEGAVGNGACHKEFLP